MTKMQCLPATVKLNDNPYLNGRVSGLQQNIHYKHILYHEHYTTPSGCGRPAFAPICNDVPSQRGFSLCLWWTCCTGGRVSSFNIHETLESAHASPWTKRCTLLRKSVPTNGYSTTLEDLRRVGQGIRYDMPFTSCGNY